MATAATASNAAVADIEVVGLRKTYEAVEAVAGIDFEVGAGTFFTLLGPSGSGKTTTLRLIAGFERPDAGRVSLAGRENFGLWTIVIGHATCVVVVYNDVLARLRRVPGSLTEASMDLGAGPCAPGGS